MERKQQYMIFVIAITLVVVCLSVKPDDCDPSDMCNNGKSKPKCRSPDVGCKPNEVAEGNCSLTLCCASPASDAECQCISGEPGNSGCIKCCRPDKSNKLKDE
ncbi:hypothetical protein MAR_004418 [Mya arenaria]|uniref:Uncharacterized protein n=1 Tax=Mya arenaria TaxID=6604 RepID=A0ABY7EWI8_MYAAR|nr:uncharacterized protein LOC128245442 [Mya arenaria]WAR14313.1 hypothetical protein MAR_004418 [Mya arenaria]